MTTQLSTHRDLLTLAGTELGTSGWVEITQSQVDKFAEATGDHQWIHVDPQRAKTGPFGGTIATWVPCLRKRRPIMASAGCSPRRPGAELLAAAGRRRPALVSSCSSVPSGQPRRARSGSAASNSRAIAARARARTRMGA